MSQKPVAAAVLSACALAASVGGIAPAAPEVSIRIDSAMAPPRWARLERQLLADNVPACREFFRKYFDDRGYLQCVVRW